MRFLQKHLRVLISAILLTAIPAYLYLGGEIRPIGWFQRLVFSSFMPVVKGIRFVEEGAKNTFRRYLFLTGVMRENEALKAELARLKARGWEWERDREVKKRLEFLVGFQNEISFQTLVARVIAYPPGSGSRRLTVDRGRRDGIVLDAAVISSEGLVGRIVRVEETTAQVLLVIDPLSVVDTRIARTGARGLIIGEREGLKLEYWNQAAETEEGDRVMTSGLDGIFPAGIPIGKVTSLRREKEKLFLEGVLTPAVDFYKLQEVLIEVHP